MAAMNRTQREHMMNKLRKMAKEAVDKQFPDVDQHCDEDDDTRISLNQNWTLNQLILAIKAGTVVAKPNKAREKVEDVYGGPDNWLIPAKGVAILEAKLARIKEREALEEALNEELEAVRDRLIFQDVSGVNSIIEGFELSIKRVLNSKK